MTERTFAIPVQRGCGERVQNGVYWETESSPYGHPVEYFLQCPPVVMDFEALGVTPVGVKTIELRGVTHILDWIGSENYPNVCDWVEEVRRFGVSRRLPGGFPWAHLTPESRLLVLHSRAKIVNVQPYWDDHRMLKWCPGNVPGHPAEDWRHDMCGSLWWEDLIGGKEPKDRLVVREMPSFVYGGFEPPAGADGEHQLAIFGSFPLGRLVVVRDQENKCESTAAFVRMARGVQVDIVEA